jgi:hypothetical protein
MLPTAGTVSGKVLAAGLLFYAASRLSAQPATPGLKSRQSGEPLHPRRVQECATRCAVGREHPIQVRLRTPIFG